MLVHCIRVIKYKIPVRIFFSNVLIIEEEDNVCISSTTTDGIYWIDSCLCLSLWYKRIVRNDEEIVVNINIIIEYERPWCRIPLKENIVLNVHM